MKKILIVDDDIRNIKTVTAILESYDVEIISAEGGKEGIQKLTSGVDLVIMDIMMPEYDGYDTIKDIRKIVKYQTLPIIALTAKAMRGDREKCLMAGATDYITKPINKDQLVSMINVWLS